MAAPLGPPPLHRKLPSARKQQQELISAQNEAVNSHLVGIALVQWHEEQAIDAVWLRKFQLDEISKRQEIAVLR